jgi:hypothetical protein
MKERYLRKAMGLAYELSKKAFWRPPVRAFGHLLINTLFRHASGFTHHFTHHFVITLPLCGE